MSSSNFKKNVDRNSIRVRIFSIFKVSLPKKTFFSNKNPIEFVRKNLFLVILASVAYYLFSNNFFLKASSKDLQRINPVISVQLYHPIISTPYLIHQKNNNFLLTVADVGGNIYGISFPEGSITFTCKMPGPVVASISGADCNGDRNTEILVSDQLGNYIFWDTEGNFLYKNRHVGGGYFAKSLILKVRGSTVFSDIFGEIHSIQNSYGKVLWKWKSSAEHSFYSTPIFMENKGEPIGIFLSKNGTWLQLNLSTGTVVIEKKLQGNFLASACIGNFLEDFQKLQCVAVSTEGNIFLLDSISGEILQEFSLEEEVVSTPILINSFEKNKIQEVIISTQSSASVYRINFVKGAVQKLLDSPSKEKVIRSTPILLDLNGDGKRDILVVSGDGVIYTFDVLGNKIYEDYFLETEVTATPVFFIKEGKIFGVFCGENGIVNILNFSQTPTIKKSIFSKKNHLVYGEFLGNEKNQNDPKFRRIK